MTNGGGEVSERAAEMTAVFDAMEATEPSDAAARDVRDGDDPYNAVQYAIDIAGAAGPLADLDVVIKENMAVSGVPMHCGSAAMEVVPGYHASVVRRLVESGANLIGTAHMDEFAYHTTGETCAFGRTANPVVDGCVPGGSSSGSASAVAGGIADAAIGSDTGGSVRIPASYCGVVGLKPTYGRVSRFGLVMASPKLDHIGPIARDVETVARVFDAIAGPDGRDPTTRGCGPAESVAGLAETGEGMRVGVVQESFETVDAGVRDAVEDAIGELESQGVACEDVSIPSYGDAPLATLAISGREFPAIAAYGGTPMGLGPVHTAAVRDALQTALHADALGDHVREQVQTGAFLNEESIAQYVTAKRIAQRLTVEVEVVLENYDALVTPTMPTTAPEFGMIDSMPAFLRSVAHTAPCNLTGHPALTVPVGVVDEAPVGLQLIGPYAAEQTVCTLGQAATT